MQQLFQEHKCLSEKDIQNYIKGQLSADERHRVENHLLDCPLCDDAVDGYRVLAEGTKVQNTPQPAIRRKLFTPLRVAAAVVVLIGGAWMFNLVLGDSSPEALFSSAYQLYPSDLDVNYRGGEGDEAAAATSVTAFQQAMELYEKESFEAAIPLFQEALDQEDTQEMVVRFYLGLSLLETDQLNDATFQLQQVANAGRDYGHESQWYLALTNLKKGDAEAARQQLQKIIETGSQHRYFQQAKQTLDEM
jgi:tetratricopeptide (TPR) repeat protein